MNDTAMLGTGSPGVDFQTKKLIMESPTVKCECGCKVFTQGMLFKKVSPVLSGTGNAEYYPIPVMYCVRCGRIAPNYKENKNFKEIVGE